MYKNKAREFQKKATEILNKILFDRNILDTLNYISDNIQL